MCVTSAVIYLMYVNYVEDQRKYSKKFLEISFVFSIPFFFFFFAASSINFLSQPPNDQTTED